jgi:short-subunit dehydrogenase
LLPKIKKWIIFIWSISSKKSWSLWASYAASKFWLRWFAMQLKNEVKWIKISIINPKIVKTNFHKNSKIEIVWKYKETSLDEILKVVKKIFSSEEKRFEIDL